MFLKNNPKYNTIFKQAKKVYHDMVFDVKNIARLYIENNTDSFFNINSFLFQFDVLIQAILIKVSFSDGNVNDSELRFIRELVENGDIFKYMYCCNNTELSITLENGFDLLEGKHSLVTLKWLSSEIDKMINNICKSFIIPFSKVDYFSNHDNYLEFWEELKVICECLCLVDGYSSDIEKNSYFLSYKKIFYDNYIDEIRKLSDKNSISKDTVDLSNYNIDKFHKVRLEIDTSPLNYQTTKKDYELGIVAIETAVCRGNGFFVSPNGYILTCYHVIKNYKHDIIVYQNTGKEIKSLPAVLVNFDEKLDIALLKVDGTHLYLEINEPNIDVIENEKIVVVGYDNLQTPEISSLKHNHFSGKVIEVTDWNNFPIVYCNLDTDYGYSGSPVISSDTGKVIGILQGMLTHYDSSIVTKKTGFGEVDYFQSMYYVWKRFFK